MAEKLEITDVTLEGEHVIGGTPFNLFRAKLRAENGVEYEGIEVWREKGKDPLWAGETVVGSVEHAGKDRNTGQDRRKLRVDWRATNALRSSGGGGQPQAASDRPPANVQQPVQPVQQPTYEDKEAARQASIEYQSAMKVAVEYGRLMYDATGQVPDIGQIKAWTKELTQR